MKTLVFLLLAFTIAFSSNAQTEIKKKYYKSGKIKSETPYVDGKINGVKKEYFENGILESEAPMLNGEVNGTYKWYFESGILKWIVDYVNGKRNGIQKTYYKSGNVEAETVFRDGVIISSRIFDDVNLVIKTEVAKADTFIKKYNTDTCISGNCKNGFGTLLYITGHTYTGNWVNSLMSGKGKFTAFNGNVYEGDFKNGSAEGKGIYRWANGDVYDGDWVNNARQGKGNFTWANGDVYNGDWVNGVQQGKGEMTWQRKEYYIGDWVNGIRQGKGRSRDTENRIKEGDWVNDKFIISQEQWELNEELMYKIKQLREQLEISRQSYLNAVYPNNANDIERYERARANVEADMKYMESEIYRLSQLIIE